MASQDKYIRLSQRFVALLDEIKRRTEGGLDISGLRDGGIVVRQGSGLSSVGAPGNMAFIDLHTGLELPGPDLGQDGDLFFQASPVLENKMPSYERWINGATSNSTVIMVADDSDVVARSEDGGSTWVNINVPTRARWADVATNGKGVFVAIAFDGEIMRSTDDGLTWVDVAAPEFASTRHWTSMSFGNGKWIAGSGDVAGSENRAGYRQIYSSDNGATWNISTLDVNHSPNDATYGASGGWVASFFDADFVMQSTDGVNWNKRQLPTTADWARVEYVEGRYSIPAMGGNTAVWSDDGINWNVTLLPSTAEWSRSAHGAGVTVMAPHNGSHVAVSFDRGKSWSRYALNTAGQWASVLFTQGKFLITELSGDRQLSIDVTEILDPTSIGLSPTDPAPSGGGSYCQAVSTKMHNLSVFFTARNDLESYVDGLHMVYWSQSGSEQNVGKLWQVPDNIINMGVSRRGQISMMMTRSVFDTLGVLTNGVVKYTLKDDACNVIATATADRFTEQGLVFYPVTNPPGTTYSETVGYVVFVFPTLRGLAEIEPGKRYCFELS